MATATITIITQVDDSKTTPLAKYTGSYSSTADFKLATSDLSQVYIATGSGAGPDTYDLTAGLTNAYGEDLAYTTLKAVVIKNTHNSAVLVVGGGTDAVLGTDQYTIGPGRAISITTAVTVDGTHKNLLITPSVSATYDIVILGA